jgi:membrane associated rhomboid family serine protease
MRTKIHSTDVGPEFTPPIIKYLILATSIASVITLLSEGLIKHFLGIPGLIEFFGLSLKGISNFYLWQPFTYFFLYGAAPGSVITFFWLLGLSLNMYILWVIGSNIAERVSAIAFSKMYILSGFFAGLCSLTTMYLTGYNEWLYGPAPCLLATMVVWSMLNPDSNILLFFVIPIKSRWLIAGVLIAIVLINLSGGYFVELTMCTTGMFVGYLYGLWAWELKSPFARLEVIDQRLINLKNKFSNLFFLRSRTNNNKIYDFHTGEPLDNDDRFMDAMLDKISKTGKESLTWFERLKMNRIAKRKKNKQK